MTVSRQQLERILKAQKYRCFLTGRPLTPSDVSVDHLVPLSRGGSQDVSNLRLVTRGANHAKSNLLLQEFVELCRDVVAEDRRRKRRKRGKPKRRPRARLACGHAGRNAPDRDLAQLCQDVVAETRRRKYRR